MDRNLYAQMSKVMRYREDKGYDTNARALRAWLEWADKPFGSGYARGLADHIEGGQYEFYAKPYRKDWFTNTPHRDAGRTKWSAWLSPQGMWWNFEYAHHFAFTDSAFSKGTRYLEIANWLHVSGGSYYQYYELTPKQRRAIEEYAAAGYRLYSSALDPVREGYPKIPEQYDDVAFRGLSKAPIHSYDWKDERWWRDATMRPEYAAGMPVVMGGYDGRPV